MQSCVPLKMESAVHVKPLKESPSAFEQFAYSCDHITHFKIHLLLQMGKCHAKLYKHITIEQLHFYCSEPRSHNGAGKIEGGSITWGSMSGRKTDFDGMGIEMQ